MVTLQDFENMEIKLRQFKHCVKWASRSAFVAPDDCANPEAWLRLVKQKQAEYPTIKAEFINAVNALLLKL